MHPVLSTYKVLADKLLQTDSGDQWVDWALEMLQHGYETENLIILAGLTPPYNSFYLKEITGKVLKELDIRVGSDEQSIKGFAYYLVHQSLEEKLDKIIVLKILKDICVRLDYEKSLYPFYLLYFAHQDLLVQPVQFYWEGAHPGNINEIIEKHFINWKFEFEKESL